MNAFIFFIAQVSRKPQVPVPGALGVFVIREHLKFYRKLVKIPEITSEAIVKLSSLGGGGYLPNAPHSKHLLQPQSSKKTQRKAAKQDKLTRLYLALIKRNEKDVINLL